MREFYIGKNKIDEHSPVYFIAEAGVNHEGNIHLAKALVAIAKWADVDALKVQTFKADLIVTKNAEKAEYQQENLKTKDSQYEMLRKLELNEAGHEFILNECRKNNLEFLSTPHSGKWSVDYLDSLGVNAFKIASPDLTNIPLLKYIAIKQKPIILSTGMGTLEEVIEAVETIKREGNDKIVALHCTSNYPCPLEEVNLNAMKTIERETGVLVGYSDHTDGIEIPIMATALGARVIEKHYTIDQKIQGNSPDHTSSLTPSQIKECIEAIRFVEQERIREPLEAVYKYKKMKDKEVNADDINKILYSLKEALGDGIKKPTESELKIMPGIRKSIVATRQIAIGEKITEENVDIKRPMGGLEPKNYETLTNNGNFWATKPISVDDLITQENSNYHKI